MQIIKTNYSPQFGFKALVSLLNKKGAELLSKGKARTTNSYYIEAEIKGLCLEIRLSDHTKFQFDDTLSSIDHTEIQGMNGLCRFCDINIVDSAGYQEAKKYLNSL